MEHTKKYTLSLSNGICIAALGLLVNVALSSAARGLHLPLYLDSLGTVLAAMLGGPLPAILAGLCSNVIAAIFETGALYRCLISALIALAADVMHRRGMSERVGKAALAAFIFAGIGGVLRSVLVWFLRGGTDGTLVLALAAKFSAGAGLPSYPAVLGASLLTELLDKAITVAAAIGIWRLLPVSIRERLDGMRLHDDSQTSVRNSLLKKVVAIVLSAELLLGILTCTISYYLYQDAAIRKYTAECQGVTSTAAQFIDSERVDDYIALGHAAPDYDRIEAQLYALRDSFPETEYLYFYRIEPDGCHVVFDLDADGVQASEPGDLVEFDESFDAYVPTLLAGGEIEPIVTNDTYGWLLTVYHPVYDAAGRCVCYAAADVSMNDIITDETSFVVRTIFLYFGVSILFAAAILELVKIGAVFPLNAMAVAAGQFAYDTDEGRVRSLEKLRSLDIHSRDEVGNLYESLRKMAEDSADYIQEIREKSRQLSEMQSGIITDFAEMVEARDKCTGDHIKNTSHYVKSIAEELQREGKFPDKLTDEYIEQLTRSAPLHDVGKIKISDLILNKPGKLTDEEFALMKTHTTEGRDILTKSSAMNDAGEYLHEAVEMASYHHERWDGKGYPTGLAGEDIPLSARIMAVADVFDALVSQRSYKTPFTFEQAVDIIRQESGTHFDPVVVDAFLAVARKSYDEMLQKTEAAE